MKRQLVVATTLSAVLLAVASARADAPHAAALGMNSYPGEPAVHLAPAGAGKRYGFELSTGLPPPGGPAGTDEFTIGRPGAVMLPYALSLQSLEAWIAGELPSGSTGTGTTGTLFSTVNATASGLPAGAQPSASASIAGTSLNLQFAIPQGAPGAPGAAGAAGATGPAPTLAIGTPIALPAGATPTATISGTNGSYTLTLGLPAGASGVAGAVGPAPALAIGTVSALAAGAAPTASISGSSGSYVLNLGVPAGLTGVQGQAGPAGAAGAAASLAMGAVTQLVAGAQPTATLTPGSGNVYTLALGIPAGSVGSAGQNVLSGTAATPSSSLGNNGDLYLVQSTGEEWTKAGGAWSDSGLSLRGPQGLAGSQGSPGTAGQNVLSGTAATPASSLGNNGDLYLVQSTGEEWTKAGGAWSDSGLSLRGPQGLAGGQGSPGTAGQNVLSGTAATPSSSLGNNGDLYLVQSTGEEWTKAGGAWSDSGLSLRGPQGLAGSQGSPGTAGQNVLSGTAATPASSLGNNGDLYLVQSTGEEWTKAGGAWSDSGLSLRGPQGLAGSQGSPGTAGQNVLSGTAATPASSLGNNGDLYLVQSTGEEWTKAGGAWSDSGLSLRGPQGLAGSQGSPGTAGQNVLSGTAATPASSLGNNGDLYLVQSTGEEWTKAGGAWSDSGLSLRGPQGLAGSQGSPGGTPTLAIGTVTTGAAGSSAAVADNVNGLTNTLSFTIPQGAAGTGSASSKTLAVGSPYAVGARTLCNVEGDAIKVDDYEPVNGPGGTLGTSYGSTLSAVAAYSTTDCNGTTITPFAWMTDGQYSGGLRWTETAGNGQDTVQVGVLTAVFFSGATSVSTPNTSGVPVGAVLYDGTSNSKVGVITSVNAGSGFGISAGAAVGGYAGDTFYILTDTAATAATSTSSATLAVGANFAAAAGTYVYDSTTSALIGTVSSTTSTTGVTLAANAASAVASGDTLAFYSATETLWLEACTRCTYPAGASTRYAKYTDPAYETFYPQVGDTITSSCLPAGTTISAIDTTPTDATYGQITLSQASTTLCAYNASYVISYPDSSMSGLADDWVAFQSAAAAAFSNHTNSYRAITLPDHVLYVNRPLWNATYSGSALQSSNGLNHVAVVGHEGESVIVSQIDLGADKCSLSGGWNGALASSSNSIYYHGFSLFGPGVASGAAVTVGNSPSADVGLCLAEGDRADLIDARGFHAGFGIAIGDHQEVNNSSATTNYTAVEFMPGQLTLGNQRFFNDILVGNYETSFEIAASAQFDSGGVYEVHVGFSPYGWLKDAASPLDPYPGGAGFVTNVVMINNWYEATGNGAWKDLSGQGTLDQDTFIGAQNAFDTQYSGDALPGTAAYAFDVGNFTNNKFFGGNNLSDYGHVTNAMIHVYGNCANNTFSVGPTPITGATATKPFMLCSNNQGGNKFIGGITATLYKAGAVLTPGQSATLNSSGLVVAYSGGSYMGAVPTGESNSTTGGYGGLTLANEMVPVVTSGSNITIEDDPNGSSLTYGQAIAPSSDGYYGAGAAGWAGSLGISTAAPGAGQTGSAELR